MINIDNAMKIRGWTTERELTWLATKASSRKHILEIGSYLGRSCRAMAENTDGVVYAVDAWTLVPQMAFMRYMDGLKNVFPLQATSEKALRQLDGLKFDMIFIDADHSYQSIWRDISACLHYLMPNGLLCGHDFTDKHPGVIQAVNELVKNFQTEDTIWFKEVE